VLNGGRGVLYRRTALGDALIRGEITASEVG
jgi:hypothetical protein